MTISKPHFCRWVPLHLARIGWVSVGAICVLVLLAAQSDNRQDQAAREIILTLIDQSWVDEISQERLQEELKQFTNETGIRVEVLARARSSCRATCSLAQITGGRARIPDVYAVDVIWPEILADNLVDLKTYVPAQEIAAHFPELIDTYTVNGRLVALPFILNEGLLFYRVDLLREYGYSAPPKPGTSLKAWRNGFRPASAPKATRNSGGMCGKEHPLRL